MSSELLRGILADPDDDALRLVYADALLAKGDPRGELIVTELRLAQQPAPELAARRNELRRMYGATWWPELPIHNVRTRGGFVDAIAAPVDELPNLPSLFAREPIRELELFDAAVDAEVIAELPPLRGLAAHSLTPSGLTALLGSDLESLDIAGAPIHDIDLGAGLRACRRLNIAHNGFWLDDLLSWEHLGALRELDISVSDVEALELVTLLERAPMLETLRASGNPLGDVGALAIADRLDRLPRLALLDIYGCTFSGKALSALPPHPALVRAANRTTIDLVGSVVELELDGDRYRVRVDGEPSAVRFGIIHTTAIQTGYTAAPRVVDAADLRDLARAIALGCPRDLVRGGAELARRDTPIMTARVLVGDPLEIDLDYYVD